MDEILSVWTGRRARRPAGALVWILLLVVGTNPTTLFQNISQLRNDKDMADRNEAFGNKRRSIEARK